MISPYSLNMMKVLKKLNTFMMILFLMPVIKYNYFCVGNEISGQIHFYLQSWTLKTLHVDQAEQRRVWYVLAIKTTGDDGYKGCSGVSAAVEYTVQTGQSAQSPKMTSLSKKHRTYKIEGSYEITTHRIMSFYKDRNIKSVPSYHGNGIHVTRGCEHVHLEGVVSERIIDR